MKYMGSKNSIAKYLLPIILKDRKQGQYYIEPFVGGANMIDKVEGDFKIGADSNEYLIALLKEMQKPNFKSPHITEEQYIHIKNNIGEYEKWLVGYAGTQLSFGATWFGSYRKDNVGKRDYSLEAQNNVNKQAKYLSGIDFYCCSYNELITPPQSIIYCDPPYDTKATKGKYKDDFDHNKFWDWCRSKSKEGHKVFVSEYNAPDDFTCVWQKEMSQRMNNNSKTDIVLIEKLFVYSETIPSI